MPQNKIVEVNKPVLYLLGGIVLFLILILIYFTFSTNNKDLSSEQQFVSTGFNPPLGNPNASVKIIEFSDFQCPSCKAAEPIIKNILKNYPNEVALYYRHFPLTQIHPNAFDAALASQCAEEQNNFWEYHDLLFENQQDLSTSALKNYAQELGLDTTHFNNCLDNEKYQNIINSDLQDVQRLGLRGTPTFFVNGREVFGADETEIRKLIEEEL